MKLKILIGFIILVVLFGCKKNEEVVLEPEPPDVTFTTCLVNPLAIQEGGQCILYPIINNPEAATVRIEAFVDIGHITPASVVLSTGTWPLDYRAPINAFDNLPNDLMERNANAILKLLGTGDWDGHLLSTIAARIIIYRKEVGGEVSIKEVLWSIDSYNWNIAQEYME